MVTARHSRNSRMPGCEGGQELPQVVAGDRSRGEGGFQAGSLS